jgi:putative intracellular protease/amidase
MPKIAIVLTEGYADWECAFLNGIGNAYYGVETINVAPGGGPIMSLGGVRTIPKASLGNVKADEFDALVICGGNIWATAQAPDIAGLANEFLTQNKHVAAICGATLALANAGILDDRRHTSNDLNFLSENSAVYAGHSQFQEDPRAVVDRHVITASGSAPVHFTAAIFRAIGVDDHAVDQFLEMLSREHVS